MDRVGSNPSNLRSPDCPLVSAALLYFDIETTGLHPERGASLTEVALLDDGGVQVHWNSDADSPDLDTLLPRLVDRLGRHVLVGHNLQFDLGFVAYEAARRDLIGPRVRYVDTLELARRHHPDRDGYRLDDLVAHFDLDVDGTLHSACADVRATRDLLCTLADRNELETLADAGLSQIDWTAV